MLLMMSLTIMLLKFFNGQFKAWYVIQRNFNSFEFANTFISLFIFFFNFTRLHSSLNNQTPSQETGVNNPEKERLHLFFVS